LIHKLAFIITMLFSATSYCQKEKAQNYVNKYAEIAIKEMKRSGVPASITLAQGILESQFGESELSKKSNNHFGIKCKLDWAGEKVYHDDDINQECFRKYNDVEESYADHSNFLKTRAHYSSLFNLEPTDYEGWAFGLKKAGYATELDYPQKLIKLIKEYNLNSYTLLALDKQPNSNKTEAIIEKIDSNATKIETKKIDSNTTKVVALQQDTLQAKVVATKLDSSKNIVTKTEEAKPLPKNTETVIIEQLPVANNSNVVAIVAKKTYPSSGTFKINNSIVFWAKEGTSLLAIAENYNITLSKLLEINDLNEIEILDKDQLIFLEKKQKKGATDFHIVLPNETLQEISQTEGIRLEAIVEYNGINKKLNPIVGEKLYLTKKAPVAVKATSKIP
jgi:Mannosyl-glycoprotein endo-beta-N-acetylglucosaminidase/LysM domain